MWVYKIIKISMNQSLTLESLDKKIDGYAESTIKRFNVMEEKMNEEFLYMHAGFDRMEKGFERMDRGFEKMDERMALIDERMARADERMARVDERMARADERMIRMDDRQDSLEAKLDDFMLMIQRIFMAKGQNPFAEGSDISE